VRHIVAAQLRVQVLDGGRDAGFFVASGNDDRQPREP
jgi:hypothetical protein